VAATAERCRDTLKPLLGKGLFPVTQGFIARNGEGSDSTLGRGGSDLTATLIGAALGADEVEIWTDVDGVMTADPGLVPEARRVPDLSFAEASALALYGARVLHPRTLAPVVEGGVPVRVRNTLRPEGRGTLISAWSTDRGRSVLGIASSSAITRVDVGWRHHGLESDTLERVFGIVGRYRLPPKLLALSELGASLAVAEWERCSSLVEGLAELGTVTITEDQGLVGIVGEGLRDRASQVGRVFAAIGRVPLGLCSLGGCERSLGFLVPGEHLQAAVRRLHRRLIEHPEVVPGGLSLSSRSAAMRA
jgi:aspartate kinase